MIGLLNQFNDLIICESIIMNKPSATGSYTDNSVYHSVINI